jgi:predicted TPR repeat methyltransferase
MIVFSDLGMPLVHLFEPKAGEHILDLCCFDGVITEKLASLCCKLIGVDSSTEMIEAAKARGIDAFVLDGQNQKLCI